VGRGSAFADAKGKGRGVNEKIPKSSGRKSHARRGSKVVNLEKKIQERGEPSVSLRWQGYWRDGAASKTRTFS